MIFTDTATQINMFQSEAEPLSTVYDIQTKAPVLGRFPLKNKKIVAPVAPVSPSGQFTPGKEDLTSDGRTKATPGDALRSYNDYTALRDYFLDPKKRVYGIRNFVLLTIGIGTGLRISDLVSLKLGHVITVDEEGDPIFKKKIDLYEKKTGKRTVGQNDSVLITEAVQTSVSHLLQAYAASSPRAKRIKKILNLDDWLFQSSQPITSKYTKDKKGNRIENPLYGEYVLTEESAWDILNKAGNEIGLDIDFNTRTTRKTFASLHMIFSRSLSTGNSAGMEFTQIALRHSSPRKTMHYLGVTRNLETEVRNMISDWLMGRSALNEIKL